MVEDRLSQATLPLTIFAVGRHDPVSDERFELVPNLPLEVDVLRVDQDVPDLVRVGELST